MTDEGKIYLTPEEEEIISKVIETDEKFGRFFRQFMADLRLECDPDLSPDRTLQ